MLKRRSFSSGGGHTAFIGKDQKVWIIGETASTFLGIKFDPQSNKSSWKVVFFKNKKPNNIAFSKKKFLISTQKDGIYECGQLFKFSDSPGDPTYNHIKRIDYFDKINIIYFSMGSTHSIFLGLDKKEQTIYIRKHMEGEVFPFLEKNPIKFLTCGSYYAKMVITKEGYDHVILINLSTKERTPIFRTNKITNLVSDENFTVFLYENKMRIYYLTKNQILYKEKIMPGKFNIIHMGLTCYKNSLYILLTTKCNQLVNIDIQYYQSSIHIGPIKHFINQLKQKTTDFKSIDCTATDLCISTDDRLYIIKKLLLYSTNKWQQWDIEVYDIFSTRREPRYKKLQSHSPNLFHTAYLHKNLLE